MIRCSEFSEELIEKKENELKVDISINIVIYW